MIGPVVVALLAALVNLAATLGGAFLAWAERSTLNGSELISLTSPFEVALEFSIQRDGHGNITRGTLLHHAPTGNRAES